MAANASPIFTLTPIVGIATISSANTNRDGTGSIIQVAAGGTDGTRIDRVSVTATVTTSAGIVALYIDPNIGTYHLWLEMLVTAITASTTVAAFSSEFVRSDGLPLIVLPANYKLGAATQIANNFRVIAHGGNY